MHTCAKVAIRKLSACPNVVLYFCGFSVARVNYCHCFSFFLLFFFSFVVLHCRLQTDEEVFWTGLHLWHATNYRQLVAVFSLI